ncbi:related to General negative regulator of transcription subunit 2 [Saccharomycodes ludwigii]|uniref:Related to General negative regulator of transcription subunit 2 n=1 Tax=Saccharomycodes ludwigii TaxID=36035 RepID=A0A376B8N8_9ASCO|nr:hypothetical protein SCDLUD_000230 [Saccharomycodes ludwigii]KAH3902649.1 hypothetical protein SCDLUD_000230 [Saccharomycodes ludwigii]SSD61048.1 related to General negative regulator of transcription subunit 2 [Saccharomycodes ludwigii]
MTVSKYGLQSLLEEFSKLQKKLPKHENENSTDNTITEQQQQSNNRDNTMITGVDLTPYIQSLNLDPASKLPFHHVLETLPSPWIETSRSDVEPRHFIPESFTKITNVLGSPVSPPVFNQVSNVEQNKISLFQDETLFYLFYKHPASAVQELTYIELRKRNWRYHKQLKVWLTKDPFMDPVVSQDGLSERGRYVFFDPQRWEKVQKDFILYYNAIM